MNLKQKLGASMYDAVFPSIYTYAHPFRILEYKALLRLAAPVRGRRVLDLGCGAGLQTWCLAGAGAEAVGLDTDARCIKTARAEAHRADGRLNIEFVCSTLQDAGFDAGSFDTIVSFSVIEHIPEYREILSLCHELLKPGGKLVLSTDWLKTLEDEALRDKHRLDHHVVHYFEPEELRRELEEAGFAEVVVDPLFRSAYARDLFLRGVGNRFTYRYREAWWKAFRLFVHERLSHSEDGIFLAARGMKKEHQHDAEV